MSKSHGSSLPDPLYLLLNGERLQERMGNAFLIHTVDVAGCPHPALLSYGEVIAVDRSTLRMALFEGSRSVKNLRVNGLVTFSLIEPDQAFYIKGRAKALAPLPDLPKLAPFEISIEEILEDQATGEEAGTRILSGITFQSPLGPEKLLQSWRETLGALKR